MAIARLRLCDEANGQAFRRMAFNVMARNCDDHSKNFSFRLRRGESWELAPAYDVTFAHSPTSQWTRRHLLSVNGKFDGILREDLLEVADRFGIGTAPRVIEGVRHAIDSWGQYADAAGVAPEQIERIAALHLPLG